MMFLKLGAFEILVLLFLLETCWWGNIPTQIFIVEYLMLGYGYHTLVLLPRVIAPLLLLFGLIKKSLNFLNLWFWVSIILDVVTCAVFAAFQIFGGLTHPSLEQTIAALILVVPFAILRLAFYKVAKSSISELQVDEDRDSKAPRPNSYLPYFRDEENQQKLAEMILTFQIVWGSLIIFSSVAEILLGLMIPNIFLLIPNWTFYPSTTDAVLDWIVFVIVTLLAGVQITAIHQRNLKRMKVLWVLLVLIGINGHCFVMGVLSWRLAEVYKYDGYDIPNWIGPLQLGSFLLNSLFTLALRLLLAALTANFLFKEFSSFSNTAPEEQEKKPLLLKNAVVVDVKYAVE